MVVLREQTGAQGLECKNIRLGCSAEKLFDGREEDVVQ